VELPEILLEIEARTGVTEELRYLSDREVQAADLPTSVCAVLIAEACKTGLSPLVRREVAALRWLRLVWVSQHDFANETLTEANARLVPAKTGSR